MQKRWGTNVSNKIGEMWFNQAPGADTQQPHAYRLAQRLPQGYRHICAGLTYIGSKHEIG